MTSRKLSSASVRRGVSQEEFDEGVQRLQARVEALEEELAALRKSRGHPSAGRNGKVIILRTVSREAAKGEIAKLFASGRTLYYSDIARRLRLDLKLVVELCQELQEEGGIEVARD